MNFKKLESDTVPTALNNKGATSSEVDKSEGDIFEIIDTLKVVGWWCEHHLSEIIDQDNFNVWAETIRLVSLLAGLFDLIPGPHQCPTPPPPCSCPHHDNKDTPMEPTTPTCAFSEAASQTPAPSHEATMPPPPPIMAATLPAAAASIPPAGPCGHASYAGAAARNLNPAAPPFMCGPPHAPAAKPFAQAQQPVSSKHSKWPFYATQGPSHHQFFIEVPIHPKDSSLPTLHAFPLVASHVPQPTFPPPPTLTQSRLPCQIVDIPFFKPGTTEPLPHTELDAQLGHSIIPSEYVVHWHFVQNSPKAEFATVWLNLSDSQQGTHTSQLIGHHLFLNNVEVLIKGAKAHTGTPQWCCYSNPKASPPIPPTAADMPCMHVCACLNCSAKHAADDHHCPYWWHHFNRSWIWDWAIQDTSACKGVPPPPSTPHGPKPMPCDHTLHPPHQGAADPPLPPIHEDNEEDNDDMELFSHELDNDYPFHE
ncbi:hypothetical protein P691DRAFT_759062 [Macrolepiota fuliginosa MF-IS2]|uniref:Uncharacterized protein n=1 Tax=Macrolepiota fuliginosa MF-IS2 TaxID=1400762 RepID=A0A9P5XEC3_9AGAR|nr:hypothetical protein P691DRAFT_759062 [Macrolepiota fuliginosa MF-IS2]